MTRVLRGEYIFEYRRELARVLRRIKEDRFIDGLRCMDGAVTPPLLADVLPPPTVQKVDLLLYEGRVEDVILITTCDNYYITSVQVRILDARGRLIEQGEAEHGMKGSNVWGYFASVRVPAETEATIRVAATDRLGGIGLGWAEKWIR
jgi:hypothetical protein